MTKKKIGCFVLVIFCSLACFAQPEKDSIAAEATVAVQNAVIEAYKQKLLGKWNENSMPAYQWEYTKDGKAIEKNGHDAPKKYFYELLYPEGFDKACIVAKKNADDTQGIIFQIESLEGNTLVLLVKLSQGLKELSFTKKK